LIAAAPPFNFVAAVELSLLFKNAPLSIFGPTLTCLPSSSKFLVGEAPLLFYKILSSSSASVVLVGQKKKRLLLLITINDTIMFTISIVIT